MGYDVAVAAAAVVVVMMFPVAVDVCFLAKICKSGCNPIDAKVGMSKESVTTTITYYVLVDCLQIFNYDSIVEYMMLGVVCVWVQRATCNVQLGRQSDSQNEREPVSFRYYRDWDCS